MLNYYNCRYVECLSYDMFIMSSSLFHTRLQILVKVLNSLCLWLLGKVVPDFLQCVSKLSVLYHFSDRVIIIWRPVSCFLVTFQLVHFFLADSVDVLVLKILPVKLSAQMMRHRELKLQTQDT